MASAKELNTIDDVIIMMDQYLSQIHKFFSERELDQKVAGILSQASDADEIFKSQLVCSGCKPICCIPFLSYHNQSDLLKSRAESLSPAHHSIYYVLSPDMEDQTADSCSVPRNQYGYEQAPLLRKAKDLAT